MSEQETLVGATGPAPAAEPTTPPQDVSRDYIILESKQQGVWQEKEKVTAGTNEEALAATKDPNQTAKYIAIAMRNWSPKSPEVETVTTVKFK